MNATAVVSELMDAHGHDEMTPVFVWNDTHWAEISLPPASEM